MRDEGEIYTPHSQSGLLQGTLRGMLLDFGLIFEKRLTLKHLHKADKIFALNSVRGIVQVKLETQKSKNLQGDKR